MDSHIVQWLCVFYGIDCGNGTVSKYIRRIKKNPFHSMAAHCVSVISTSFVAISIVGMTVSTLPALQYQDAQVRRRGYLKHLLFESQSLDRHWPRVNTWVRACRKWIPFQQKSTKLQFENHLWEVICKYWYYSFWLFKTGSNPGQSISCNDRDCFDCLVGF